MDIFILLFSGLCILVTVIFLTFLKNKKEREGPKVSTEVEAHTEPRSRRRALVANRNARARQRLQREEEEEVADDEDGGVEIPIVDLPEGKIGAKKLAKLQAKAEKKAQRENEEKLRQDKKKAQELAEEERKKNELKEQEEEKRKAEEERRIREEKEKQEYEEYLKLKEEFSVQEEGFEESGESETLLQDFINHIKKNKVVILEDIAAEFKLKTQDVINRINNLQAEGQLTGVIDDRGKFIFISQDELDAVAKFVKQRGRVSITELVENSNFLINLSPSI